ncbi:MAG: NADH-quinone oxidoreductase subunit C [Victivallales bacterium]
MIEKQETVVIASQDELLKKVAEMSSSGFRLVLISCTKLNHFQIDYTFDKNYEFKNLRFYVPVEKPEMKSISSVFMSAFTYENEIHDLFGIEVHGLNINYGGKFYRINIKAPFSTLKKTVTSAAVEEGKK